METIKSQTVDMKTIRTNDNGDYVFDVKAVDASGQIYCGYLVMKYNKYTIDTLSEWYHLNWDVSKESARQLLEDLHREGRNKLFEKCKAKDDLHEFRFKQMTGKTPDTTIFELTIYSEE